MLIPLRPSWAQRERESQRGETRRERRRERVCLREGCSVVSWRKQRLRERERRWRDRWRGWRGRTCVRLKTERERGKEPSKSASCCGTTTTSWLVQVSWLLEPQGLVVAHCWCSRKTRSVENTADVLQTSQQQQQQCAGTRDGWASRSPKSSHGSESRWCGSDKT